MSSILKEASQALEDWWFDPYRVAWIINTIGDNKRLTNHEEQKEILAHWERPGGRRVYYKTARRLREMWGLPPEPDTQTAITEFFVGVNIRHWGNVVRWQWLILDFLRSGAKAALGKVAENLNKQWYQGIPVDKELIYGHRDGQTTLGWDMGVRGIKEIVGITENQPVTEKMARLLDPHFEDFEHGKALKIGEQLCQEQGLPIEEGVRRGIKFGFEKRNTLDFVRIENLDQREEILTWLKDDARVDPALQRLMRSF